jgi:outer membrane immunogenic protein
MVVLNRQRRTRRELSKEDFMRYNFLIGAGLLALIAGTGSAVAADMPVRPPPAVAPAAAPCCVVPDWVGFYVGVHGGGGWAHESFEPSEFFSPTPGVTTPFVTPPDARPKGGVFGFQFGHNWQWGPVVGGLEIDFSGADIRESTAFFDPFRPFDVFNRDKRIDELASARGRLGYLVFPNLLLYGTAGIGWGHERIRTTAFETVPTFAVASQESFLNEFGWVAGVGLEWKFWNSWLLRGEWLHYDFGRVTDPNNNVFLSAGPFFLDNSNIRTTVDVARAAISYKFSP